MKSYSALGAAPTVPPARRAWPSGACDPCGGPSGDRTCAYVTLCAPCAAGDVAAAAGRSYARSCCLSPLLPCCLLPCVWAADRQELAQRLAVRDGVGCACACLLFTVCAGTCLLCQEVALLKSIGWYARRALARPALAPGQGGMPGPTTGLIMQQVMGSAPYAAPVSGSAGSAGSGGSGYQAT